MPRYLQKGQAGAVDVIIIGAGHAGLAMSHELAARSIEHVVLERGEVANTWRTERWDSLRLLTPNWMTRLPGMEYAGPDPDGYMSVPEVTGFITGYAERSCAPVHTGTTVTAVKPADGGYRVESSRGAWYCRSLVLATGACNLASVPGLAAALPPHIHQVNSRDYRNPEQLPDGGVLVVGASASGLQLAQEIHASGRSVTLAVGEHVRMPRIYRGRDIQWWLLQSGILDEGIADVDDAERVRRLPSPQLVGTPQRNTLDLNILGEQGIRIVGRLAGVRDGRALFSGSLRNVCAMADLKLDRLLGALDAWADKSGLSAEVAPAERPAPTRVDSKPTLGIDLAADRLRTVLWATGYRPDYSWLEVPVLDRKGRLVHDGGVVAPGLYALGLPFLRRRKSSFIHGAEDDVRFLASHLAACLEDSARRRIAGAA
jgi:putative flavoprotein involved in K+ transport